MRRVAPGGHDAHWAMWPPRFVFWRDEAQNRENETNLSPSETKRFATRAVRY
jgi:hypothetical protein